MRLVGRLATRTGGDDIIIATNGGGMTSWSAMPAAMVMSGGIGNDSFAFLETSDNPGIITDFNNLTEIDQIAFSASGFGGGLTAGMCERFVRDIRRRSGSGTVFHCDSTNRALYFSAEGTWASATTMAPARPA